MRGHHSTPVENEVSLLRAVANNKEQLNNLPCIIRKPLRLAHLENEALAKWVAINIVFPDPVWHSLHQIKRQQLDRITPYCNMYSIRSSGWYGWCAGAKFQRQRCPESVEVTTIGVLLHCYNQDCYNWLVTLGNYLSLSLVAIAILQVVTTVTVVDPAGSGWGPNGAIWMVYFSNTIINDNNYFTVEYPLLELLV